MAKLFISINKSTESYTFQLSNIFSHVILTIFLFKTQCLPCLVYVVKHYFSRVRFSVSSKKSNKPYLRNIICNSSDKLCKCTVKRQYWAEKRVVTSTVWFSLRKWLLKPMLFWTTEKERQERKLEKTKRKQIDDNEN